MTWPTAAVKALVSKGGIQQEMVSMLAFGAPSPASADFEVPPGVATSTNSTSTTCFWPEGVIRWWDSPTERKTPMISKRV
eukprot:9116014-Lingulodinium_polyedra.AAC.2